MTTHDETAIPTQDNTPPPSVVTEVLESISDGVCMLDHAWRITYVNRQAAAYFELLPADLIGKLLWDSYPQLIGTELETHFRATMESRQPQIFEIPAIFTDRWHHIQLSPSPDGMVICFQDITERKMVEQAREASERRYRELLMHAPAPIYEMDFRSRRFITVNEAMCRLTGYTREELLAMDPADLLDEEGRRAFQDRANAWLAGTPPGANVEYTIKASDGHLIYALLDVTFTSDEHGQPLGATAVGHDISEHRKIDEALRESEARYRQVVEHTTAIILRVDTHGVITFANQHALDFFGYTEDELIGRPALGSIIPPQETGGRDLTTMLEQIVAHPDDFHFNLNENVCSNGERVWIEWTNSGIYDADGRLKEFLAVGIDVTDRIRAEEALSRSEERFRVAQALSPDGFTILHPERDEQNRIIDFTWVYENATIARLNGTDPAAVIGQRLLKLSPNHAGTPFFQAYLHAAETGESRIIEAPFQDESITERKWLRLAVVSIGQDIAILAQDITERKRVEEALRESEAKFRLLADMTETAIAIVQDGVIQYANPFVLKRGGYHEEDVIGQSFLHVIHSDYHAMLMERYQQRLQRGDTVPGRYEVQGVDDDGGYDGWYDLHATTIEYRGRPAVLVTAHDITERKQMEQALLEADRAKDRFLAVLSHELQTPLTSMLGWSAEALRAGTPEMMALAMPIVHRNAVRQKHLIADLLDFSRLIHGKMHIMPERLDLGAQAREAVENVQKLAAERQLQLACEFPSRPLAVIADPARMQQCIGNLLQNSLKFTPAGGMIRVRCHRDGDWAVLAVEDTGRGISPEALPTVFEVFCQVDRDENAGGLGLGLAVCRGIIELQGGTIHAESAGCGRGSTFAITLPLAETDDEEPHDV